MFKHLKRFVVFSCIFLIVGFVSEAYSQTTPKQAEAYSHFRPSVEGKACVEYFKSTMNDPSSFQLAGDFVYDGSDTYGDPDLLVVVAPIRGKNAMGGLILKTLVCSYHYVFGDLVVNAIIDR